ncbi:glycosyltransferase [Ancylobacter sp.]|uniref:glycosyltransferase n=1 Tax=Ancylobacter sp. TaxID=1872567 RepID=UPI003D0EA01D
MHITLYYTTLAGGGTERVLVRLATEFASLGHRVDLLLMSLGSKAYADEIDARVRVVDLGAVRMRTGFLRFVAYLRRERPDVVISAGNLPNAFSAWGARTVRPRPWVVFTYHELAASAVGRDISRTRLLSWMSKRNGRLADSLVAVGPGLAAKLESIMGVPEKTIRAIHNPVWHASIEARARAPIPHPWLASRETPVVMAVGRLETVKGHRTLLDAVALLRRRRPVRLLILGAGSEQANLQARIAELGLTGSAELVGFHDNPFAWMARASVLVLSSEREGFGNVLVEAMACGTPVVSTDCPTGPPEILDGGRYGGLVAVGDAEAMATAIEQQLDAPVPVAVLRQRAQAFSAEASAMAYLALVPPPADRR